MPKKCRSCNHLLDDTMKLYKKEYPSSTRKPIEYCPQCGEKVIDA